jgi:hypothetical protein
MTIGIYKLVFKGLEDFPYIGQSLNIENRYISHCSSLRRNISNFMMLEAYEISQEYPTLEIIEEVPIDMLNISEEYWINKLDTVNNGLNLTNKIDIAASGENNPHSKTSNKKAIEVLLYLYNNPTITLLETSKIFNINKSIIKSIAGGITYSWLSEIYPLEYKIVINQERKGLNTAQYQGKVYPKICSPEGIVYNVTNIQAFSREHNLNNSSLHQVLTGKRKSCSKWKLL